MLRRCLFAVMFLGLVPGLPASEVALRFYEGRPVVDGVFVNGQGPYRFLVDTGTTINLLDLRLAKDLGLRPTFRTPLGSSLGETLLAGTDGVKVSLGDLEADGQRFLFSKMDMLDGLTSGVRGILGQSFLSRFDYLIDMRGKKLVFGKQERGGQRTPMKDLYERLVVETNLGNMVLDSGSAQLVLFGMQSGNSIQTVMHTLAGYGLVGVTPKQLSIAGQRVWSGSAVTISRREEPGVDGLLPVKLFRTVYVCNSERFVTFQ